MMIKINMSMFKNQFTCGKNMKNSIFEFNRLTLKTKYKWGNKYMEIDNKKWQILIKEYNRQNNIYK